MRTCEAADCDRTVYARGHCGRHDKQLLRHGEAQPDRAPRPCGVESCGRAAVTRGWCHGHYLRWSRTGDVRADVPLTRPEAGTCSLDGCERVASAGGLCRPHERRRQRHGDPLAGAPSRTTGAGGSLSHGYWKIPVPPDERHLVPDGRTQELEHRLVVARRLRRPLAADEVVHHVNGDRLDNRDENLELWSTAQPKGQRLVDRLEHARWLLARYDPDVARALGLDLDPATGAPRDDESLPSCRTAGSR